MNVEHYTYRVTLEKNGEDIPVPLAERTYSGGSRVRIPSDLHRKRAIDAQ